LDGPFWTGNAGYADPMDPADATHREVTRREFARQAPSSST
jgi:hypothetical protein